jgi:fructuronate reductase
MHDRLARNLPIATHALAVAGWMRYVTANDEQGRAIDVRDPLAGEFAALAREAGPVADRLAPALLGVAKVFGPLGIEPRLREAVTAALGQLYAKGARRAVETLVSV